MLQWWFPVRSQRDSRTVIACRIPVLCVCMIVSWLLRAGLLLLFLLGFSSSLCHGYGFFPGGVWAPSPKFAPLQLAPSSVLAPVHPMFTIDDICDVHSRPYHSYVKLHVLCSHVDGLLWCMFREHSPQRVR